MYTDLPAKWWAQPQLGFPDETHHESSNPPDSCPGAHLGDGDVIAATAGAELSGAGVDRAIGRSEATRARRSSGLDTLQSSLELSDLKPEPL